MSVSRHIRLRLVSVWWGVSGSSFIHISRETRTGKKEPIDYTYDYLGWEKKGCTF